MTKKTIMTTSIAAALVLGALWLEQAEQEALTQTLQSTHTETEADLHSPNVVARVASTNDVATTSVEHIEPAMPGMQTDNAIPPGFDANDVAAAWAKVDLEALRNSMPNNLYWVLAAPTSDAAVLAERKEIKQYWEAQYKLINANHADEATIRAYFEHKTHMANDYVEFATALLNRYGADMPEEGRHLQTFARNLNLVQLQELPKKLQNALDSRKAFLERRENWLADKEAYEAKLAQEREAALRELGKI